MASGILASHYPHPDNPEEDTPPIEDLNVLTEMPMEPSFWEDTTGIFYTDASGGKFSSFNRLRRIGCGACLCVHGVPKWSHYFNLPGPVQSVPRGELYAILYIVERVSPFSTIEIVTDKKKNWQSYLGGKDKSSNSANADLFSQLFTFLENRYIVLNLRWMPSHLSDEPVTTPPAGVTLDDIKGNAIADDLAGKAAAYFEVPRNMSASYVYYFSLVRKIQRRLIDILWHLPHRKKSGLLRWRFHPPHAATSSLPNLSMMRT